MRRTCFISYVGSYDEQVYCEMAGLAVGMAGLPCCNKFCRSISLRMSIVLLVGVESAMCLGCFVFNSCPFRAYNVGICNALPYSAAMNGISVNSHPGWNCLM